MVKYITVGSSNVEEFNYQGDSYSG